MALKLSTQALKLLSHVFLNAQLSISGANTAPVLFNQLHIVILISDYVMKTALDKSNEALQTEMGTKQKLYRVTAYLNRC